jgi:hypothetical protein
MTLQGEHERGALHVRTEAPDGAGARLADVEPETDVPWRAAGRLFVGGVELELSGTTLFRPDRSALATSLYEAPAVDGDTLCAASEGGSGDGLLQCWHVSAGATGQPMVITTGGRPDRVAVAGENVAWVASPQGLPQVFVRDTRGATPSRALTNMGLQVGGGGPPAGFVPPPHRGRLRFDGDTLRWSAPDGEGEVRWR